MVVLGLLACAGRKEIAPTPAEALPFTWPAPPGWRNETIPFPLDFAPGLAYDGIEELRFAPDFFEPTAPTFFSYAFVWWLEGQPELGAERLEQDLVTYFAGLASAVGRKKYSFDPARFQAELNPELDGRVETYDPFVTGAELTLQVEIAVRDCPDADRKVLLALLSPKTRPDPMWDALDRVGAGFACR